MDELKPCPFCGGKAQLDHNTCGINITSIVRYYEPKEKVR